MVMQALLRDLHVGARMLSKNLGFTLTAILTLALGIGANTAIFTVTNALSAAAVPLPRPTATGERGREGQDQGLRRAHCFVMSWCATITSHSSRWPYGRMTI